MRSILFIIVRTYRKKLQCNYPRNKKLFLEILLCLLNLHQIWSIFFKKNNLITYVFPKLRTAKNVLREMFKKPRFRTSFDGQHANASQTLLKSARKHYYHIFLSLWVKWSWKMSLLVILEILGLFVSTLTGVLFGIVRSDHKQFKRNFIRNTKLNFWIFYTISEIYFNFPTFQKKEEPQSQCIPEIMDCDRR